VDIDRGDEAEIVARLRDQPEVVRQGAAAGLDGRRHPLRRRRRLAPHRPPGRQRAAGLLAQHRQLLQRTCPPTHRRPAHPGEADGQELQVSAADEWKWNGRDVFIADGSHVSMPDTEEN
jgi:hypothetical protein